MKICIHENAIHENAIHENAIYKNAQKPVSRLGHSCA